MRINDIVYVIFDEDNRRNFMAKVRKLFDGYAIVENYDKEYDCWEEKKVSKESLRKIS